MVLTAACAWVEWVVYFFADRSTQRFEAALGVVVQASRLRLSIIELAGGTAPQLISSRSVEHTQRTGCDAERDAER